MPHRRGPARKWVIALVCLLIVLLYFFPIYFLLNISVRDYRDLSSRLFLTTSPTMENYIAILKDKQFWNSLKNTILLFLFEVVFLIPAASLGGYGLARVKGRVSNSIRSLNVLIMMIPSTALLVGTYSLMVNLGLTNSIAGLALLQAGTGMTGSMFFYTTFTSSIPLDLDEAAAIDGAGVIRTFFMIIFPQMKAVTITRVIGVLTGCWNSYLMPMYMLTKGEKYTVLLYVRKVFSSSGAVANVPLAFAGCTLMILPILIFYFAMQKQIVGGQLDSSIKG